MQKLLSMVELNCNRLQQLRNQASILRVKDCTGYTISKINKV